MHEEATSMSVPSSVAVSTAVVQQQSVQENGNTTTTTPTTNNIAVVVNAEDIELNTETDNIDLQVPFSSNSAGKKRDKNRTILPTCVYRLSIRSFPRVPCNYTRNPQAH